MWGWTARVREEVAAPRPRGIGRSRLGSEGRPLRSLRFCCSRPCARPRSRQHFTALPPRPSSRGLRVRNDGHSRPSERSLDGTRRRGIPRQILRRIERPAPLQALPPWSSSPGSQNTTPMPSATTARRQVCLLHQDWRGPWLPDFLARSPDKSAFLAGYYYLQGDPNLWLFYLEARCPTFPSPSACLTFWPVAGFQSPPAADAPPPPAQGGYWCWDGSSVRARLGPRGLSPPLPRLDALLSSWAPCAEPRPPLPIPPVQPPLPDPRLRHEQQGLEAVLRPERHLQARGRSTSSPPAIQTPLPAGGLTPRPLPPLPAQHGSGPEPLRKRQHGLRQILARTS